MTDIQIDQYFQLYQHYPLIDVRSPGEFEKGHIPGAFNIPLFSNDERAHVGTVYKNEGQDKAIELGFQYVTPKLQWFVDETLKIAPDKKVIVHCWRGGMRSHSFAKHLIDNGFQDVKVITKGYKAFRNFVLNLFEKEVDLKVIGGFTGSGKTHILHQLQKMNCQVVDLEQIAKHKGSAFGSIGEDRQPTVEQFENNLFLQWYQLDFNKPVYVEDESHSIGGVKIPMSLYKKIRESRVYFLHIPKEKRAKLLVDDYARFDNQLLKNGILKITKKLGGLVTQQALEALDSENYFDVAMLALNYYDKSYLRGVERRKKDLIEPIELNESDPKKNAIFLKNYIEKNTIINQHTSSF